MLLSLVIPVYNEEEGIAILLQRLRGILGRMDCEHEIVFVNDGSRDRTLELLLREAAADWRIKVLDLTRNFGHQAAITAGLDCADGDAVVVMDADLQDPPELLPALVERYLDGYEVVSAQRVSRRSDSWFKRITASLFYRSMRRLVDERLVEEVGDFRLFSRSAVVAIRGFREQHRFMRGLVAWLGLKEAIVPFERQPRAAGVTKYPFYKMLRFAWTAVTSFSALPLRLSMAAGMLLSAGGFLYFFYSLYMALIRHAVVPGWTSIVVLQCIFSGVTLLALGLVGDYIAKIYEESKQRPLYVVRQGANIALGRAPAVRSVLISQPEPVTHTPQRELLAERTAAD